MADKVERRWCPACMDWRKATQIAPNHILHFLLCIPTGGLWAFVWIWVSMGRPFKCDECGAKTKRNDPRKGSA